MTLKFYDSLFHVTHDKETASKMAMKMELSIMLSNLIKERSWTQNKTAAVYCSSFTLFQKH